MSNKLSLQLRDFFDFRTEKIDHAVNSSKTHYVSVSATEFSMPMAFNKENQNQAS